MIERKIYVSSVNISDIKKSFETGNNERMANQLCNLEYIPSIKNATSGIRLSENIFVLSNNHEMPVIIERGKKPIRVFWIPSRFERSQTYHKVVFVSSSADGSEVYGYSGDKILKLTRRKTMAPSIANQNNLILYICILIGIIVITVITIIVVLVRRRVHAQCDSSREVIINDSDRGR